MSWCRYSIRILPHDDRLGVPLQEPLSLSRIEAAGRIYEALVQWRISDESLRALASAFADFSPTSCVLKVVTVNSLYGTNVYATLRMADHVARVMNDPNRPREAVPLVERIADLPPRPDEKPRHRASFASKFVHFFVDSNAPIYDSYAQATLKAHLGRRRGIWDEKRPYAHYVRNIDTLLKEAGLKVDVRSLDRYLWLVGQSRAWQDLRRKGKRETTNRELAEMFRNPHPRVAAELAELLGTEWIPEWPINPGGPPRS